MLNSFCLRPFVYASYVYDQQHYPECAWMQYKCVQGSADQLCDNSIKHNVFEFYFIIYQIKRLNISIIIWSIFHCVLSKMKSIIRLINVPGLQGTFMDEYLSWTRTKYCLSPYENTIQQKNQFISDVVIWRYVRSSCIYASCLVGTYSHIVPCMMIKPVMWLRLFQIIGQHVPSLLDMFWFLSYIPGIFFSRIQFNMNSSSWHCSVRLCGCLPVRT